MVNLYKWAGFSFTYKDVGLMRKILGTAKPNQIAGLCGTWTHTIDDHLKKSKRIIYKGYIHCYNRNTLKNIDKHLNVGGSCLVNVYWSKNGGGHYFNIIGHTKQKYVTVNYGEKMNTVALISKKQIAKYMKNYVLDAEGYHPSSILMVFKNE